MGGVKMDSAPPPSWRLRRTCVAIAAFLLSAPLARAQSCANEVHTLEKNTTLSRAMDAYYRVRGPPAAPRSDARVSTFILQNISFPGPDGVFSTTQIAENALENACNNVGGGFCSGGGNVQLGWVSNHTGRNHFLEGSVSLCFPAACCTSMEWICDDADGIAQWVGDELVAALDRMCALDVEFCFLRDGHNIAISQECTTVTLKEIVLIAAAVVLATGCAFALVTCVCRRRYRRMQMHWMAAYELENASALEGVRERLLAHHVTTYDSFVSKDKGGDTCAICLEGWKATDEVAPFEPCGHLFHAPCITQWMTRKDTCPVCRAKWSDRG